MKSSAIATKTSKPAKTIATTPTVAQVRCLVCLDDSPTAIYIHGPCNHINTCCNCFLMNKLKFQRDTCVLCNEQLLTPFVNTFTHSKVDYNQYEQDKYVLSKVIGAYFPSKKLLSEYEYIVNKIVCHECNTPFPNLQELKQHVRTAHQKEFCSVCLTKRKVFVSDQRIYSSKDLTKHRTQGDPAMGEFGPIAAHVKCNLCQQWMYDKEDHTHHLQMKHQSCQLCKRRGKETWLNTQADLIRHYREGHLICDNDECCKNPLENVFDDEILLQTHILKVHSKSVSRQERKAASRLNVDFCYTSTTLPSSSSTTTSSTTSRSPRQNSNNTTASSSAHNPNSKKPSNPSTVSDEPPRRLDVMSEIKSILGEVGCQEFRYISMKYFKSEISAQDYFNEFCRYFAGYSGISLLFSELVSSLPDFKLRENLYVTHHEAVKTGFALSKLTTKDIPNLPPRNGNLILSLLQQSDSSNANMWTTVTSTHSTSATSVTPATATVETKQSKAAQKISFASAISQNRAFHYDDSHPPLPSKATNKNSNQVISAWGKKATTTDESQSSLTAAEDEIITTSIGKKNKSKKVMLFQVGMRHSN